MMVRTIQHPGTEILETEMGSYTRTVVMNNAYIMGFTDRGPIYDYSFISTTSEFTKIYGEPQSEAEKYMFTAVQSVLANGGTPIVARMPYDNKQCKAYKALKMKWVSDTSLISRHIENDLGNPVIPLSTLTENIKKDKSFNEIFTEENITIDGVEDVAAVLNNLTIEQAAMLLSPYKDGSEAADGEIYDEIKDFTGLKINGVYPSAVSVGQEAISNFISSLKKDTQDVVYKAYKYDEGYNVVNYYDEAEITSSFLSEEDSVYGIKNIYLIVEPTNDKFKDYKGYLSSGFALSLYKKNTGKDVFFRNHVADHDNLTEAEYMMLSSLFTEKLGLESNDIANVLIDNTKHDGNYQYNPAGWNEFGEGGSDNIDKLINALNPSGEIVPSGDITPSGNPSGNISGDITPSGNPSGEVIPSEDDIPEEESDLFACIIADDIEFYYIIGDKKFIVKTTIDDLPVYTIEDAAFAPFKEFCDNSFVDLNADEETVKKDIKKKFFTTEFDFLLEHIVNGKLVGNKDTVATKIAIDTLIPLYENTINGYKVDEDGKMTLEPLTCQDLDNNNENFRLIGFVNFDAESPAVYGSITFTEPVPKIGVMVSGTFDVFNQDQAIWRGDATSKHYADQLTFDKNGNQYHVLDATEKNFLNAFRDFAISGDVDTDNYLELLYLITLKNVYIKDITDEMLEENMPIDALRVIYNNPKFLLIDQAEYALLEAKLMNTPEMGFKYGLYLDSEECEISNDQYDDLVTVNQFKAVDRSIDKYGQDIDDANFVIVDKQKTVVQGNTGNIGFFTAVIDPFDALKVQRTLVNPAEDEISDKFDHTDSNIYRIDYWAYESADAWNKMYEDILDAMDCLQRVRNADGVYIGEPNPIDGKQNILDSWSIPLTGTYYEDSISKFLMRKFPKISMADITSEDFTDPDYIPSIIDHSYATHICVAVCKTAIDPSNGKIVVNIIETHFGSLFDERNLQNGRSLFIGDIINANSDYIEFYRNDYVSAGQLDAYNPPEYRRTVVNQIFIKDSIALRNAAQMRGIDVEEFDMLAVDPAVKAKAEKDYYDELVKFNIYPIDKKEVCIYNLHWEATLTSFSKKESQKVIANTTNLYSVNDGTTVNVASNFLVDMDRCIKFIKNVDELPLHFICDAGLSTIAQFCDNVIWNPLKKTVVGEEIDPVTKKKTGVKKYQQTGGWITQPFDPDNDPDAEDRYITGYEDVATWRKVVEKITAIAGEVRKDCFAIIDAPRQLTLDGAAPKIRRTKFTNNFDKIIGKVLRYLTGINSSYVAGYYNWLRTTDQFTGKAIWVPPTSKIIGNYCYLNINNLPWLAPAGLTYGLVSGCYAVSHNPDAQEEDQIYMKSWNYIKQYPLEGLVVEGQRTMLGKESAFERINVRLLFLDLERYAYNLSKTFKYQVNNAYTREQFVATLKPKFEDYTLRGGIYEYLIKCDGENNTPETIDANELRGDIFIKPARLIEFILLNFVATSTSTNFNELQL